MAIRLGELLVQRGMITEEQLQQALNAQLVYGGHLGTCLIEHDLVNEVDLGLALSEIYGVGYAAPEMLADVAGPVVESIPRKLVEKHRLIPFDLDGGVLHLAMIDPRDILALDETAHASGLRTYPWVSPEIRVLQAMERYYRIPRRLRFVALCRELDRERPFEPAPRRVSAAAPGPEAAPDRPARRGETDCYLGTDVDAEGRLHRGFEDLGAEFGYGRSWHEIAEEGPAEPRHPVVHPTATPPPARHEVAPAPAATAAPPLPSIALEEATERMCRADDPVQVGQALVDYAVGGTPRCVLWRVDDVAATVWAQRGFPALDDPARPVRLTVTEEPVFRLVAGIPCYRGPAPANAAGLTYFQMLGAKPPSEILLVPLHLDDRLVALFYGDCGMASSIAAATDDCRRVMLKLAYALRILELKRSIRAV